MKVICKKTLYLPYTLQLIFFSYSLNFLRKQAEGSHCTLFLPYVPFLLHIEIYFFCHILQETIFSSQENHWQYDIFLKNW